MKRLLITLKEKWPEYLLEIIVLIVGIYGAFALENWNEDRKSAQAAKSIVQNLNLEFKQNQTELNRIQQEVNGQINSGRALMTLVGKSSDELGPANTDSLLYNILDFVRYTPSQFFINEAGTDKLDGMAYDPLRKLLFDWNIHYGRSIESFQTLDAKTEDDLVPYIVDKYPMKDVDRYGPLQWKTHSTLNIDKGVMFQDVVFESHVDDMLYRALIYQENLDQLEKSQNLIIEMTEELL